MQTLTDGKRNLPADRGSVIFHEDLKFPGAFWKEMTLQKDCKSPEI